MPAQAGIQKGSKRAGTFLDSRFRGNDGGRSEINKSKKLKFTNPTRHVIPAQAPIQKGSKRAGTFLDSRFRGNDGGKIRNQQIKKVEVY